MKNFAVGCLTFILLLLLTGVAFRVLFAAGPWLFVAGLLIAVVVLAVQLANARAENTRLKRQVSDPNFTPPQALPREAGGDRLADLRAVAQAQEEPQPVARTDRRWRRAPRAEPTPEPQGPPKLSTRAGEIIAGNTGRLPEQVLMRTYRLLARLEEIDTLINAGRLDPERAHLARKIATEYLPEALEGYLMLPPSQAMTLHLVPGKTGYDLLMEQLSTLNRASKDIHSEAALAEGQSLLAHHKFLSEKFRNARGDFDV